MRQMDAYNELGIFLSRYMAFPRAGLEAPLSGVNLQIDLVCGKSRNRQWNSAMGGNDSAKRGSVKLSMVEPTFTYARQMGVTGTARALFYPPGGFDSWFLCRQKH